MQEELASERPDLPIQLLAVNEEGYESGLDTMSDLGDLPVLQDSTAAGAWNNWMATWRDVILVDSDGVAVYIFNLSGNDLGNPSNYEALKTALIAVAEGSPPTP